MKDAGAGLATRRTLPALILLCVPWWGAAPAAAQQVAIGGRDALIGPKAGEKWMRVDVDAPVMPTSKLLSRIVVDLYNGGEHLRDVGPFVLPREYFDIVLLSLGTPVFDPMPHEIFDDVGTLKLVYVDGRFVMVTWRPTGKGPIAYSVGRVPCRRSGAYYKEYGDEGLGLAMLLRAIYSRRVSMEDKERKQATVYGDGDRFYDVMHNPSILESISRNKSIPLFFQPNKCRVYAIVEGDEVGGTQGKEGGER